MNLRPCTSSAEWMHRLGSIPRAWCKKCTKTLQPPRPQQRSTGMVSGLVGLRSPYGDLWWSRGAEGRGNLDRYNCIGSRFSLPSPSFAFLPARPAKEERGPVLGWQPTRVKWDSGGLVSLRMHRRPGLLSDQRLSRLLGSPASSSEELLVGLASRSEEWLVTRSPCQSTMQGQRLDSQSTMLV